MSTSLTTQWTILTPNANISAPFIECQLFQIKNGIYQVTCPASNTIPFKFHKFANDSVRVGSSEFSLFCAGGIGTKLGCASLDDLTFSLPKLATHFRPQIVLLTTNVGYLEFEPAVGNHQNFL